MDVILLEKVQNLGKLGDRVAVRSGYARNYLLPQRKAVSATPANLAAFEQRRAELEQAEADTLTAAQTRAAELNGKSVTIAAKAGTEGKLFGSVGTIDIAEAASRDGLDLKRHEVRLPSGPFRNIGSGGGGRRGRAGGGARGAGGGGAGGGAAGRGGAARGGR